MHSLKSCLESKQLPVLGLALKLSCSCFCFASCTDLSHLKQFNVLKNLAFSKFTYQRSYTFFFQLPASPFLCNCLWHLGPCFIRFYTIRWVNLLRGPFIIDDPANRTVQYYVVGSLCLGGMVCKAGESGGGHIQWNCSQMNKSTSHVSQGNVGTSTRIFAYSVAHLKDGGKNVSGFVMIVMRLLMCILFNKIS